jgi:L-iditol 2-dehydrogenase
MKAAFVVDKGKIEIREVDIPKIQSNEVLIKVKAVGVCGSDLHLFRGTHPVRRPPVILGHEVAGEIVGVGDEVKNLKVGDRVTVDPQWGCNECEFCRQELVNLCLNKKAPGLPGWNGTCAEYFNAPGKIVHKITANVSYETAALVEPFSVGVHSINRITAKSKESLVILGSGTIGLLTLVAAQESGYQNIICTDTQEYNLNMAKKLGARYVLNPLQDDVVAKVKEFTGGLGVDVVLIMADAKNIIDQALTLLRKRGEVGLVAIINDMASVYPTKIAFGERTIFGVSTYEAKEFKKAVEMVNNGLDLSDFVTHKFRLEDSQKALDVFNERKENIIKIIIEVN